MREAHFTHCVRKTSQSAGRFGHRLHSVDVHSTSHSAPVDHAQQAPFSQLGHGIDNRPPSRANPSSHVRHRRSRRPVLRVPPQNEPRQGFGPRQVRHRTIDERIEFAEAVRRCRRSLRFVARLAVRGRCRSRSRRFHRRQNRTTRQNGRASVGSVGHRFAPHSSPASSSAAAVRPHRSAMAACSLPRGSRFVVDVGSPPPSGVKA